MKNRQSLFIGLVSIALIAGGCDVIRQSGIPLIGQKETPTNRQPAELPTDREHIRHAGHKENIYSVKDLEEGVVTGDWTIEEVNGSPVVAETPAFIKFVPSEKRIYGNNGCNTLNASYSYNQEEHTLSFSQMMATMRLCGTPGITDLDISAALANTTRYDWNHDGDLYYLYLMDDNGIVLLKLMHQNFDFLNGRWQVTSIENEPVDNADMLIVIDVDEGKIHGNTGCNILNGTMDVDMETANTLSFQDIIVTKMACPDASMQTRLIVALEDVAHASPLDKDNVVLLNLLRNPVLTLKRI